MAILGAVQTGQIFDSALVNAIGRPSLGVLFLVVRTCAVLISLVATRNTTLQTVVIGYVAAQLVVAPLNLVVLKRFAGISPAQFLARLAPTLIATAVMCGAILAVEWLTPVAGWHAFASLAAKGAAGLAAYAIALLALDRRQILDLVEDLRGLRKKQIGS